MAVYPISKRASAALMRAATEQLLKAFTKDKLPAKVNLNGRISYLEDQVSKSTHKALTIIRVLGNDVLHQANAKREAVTIYLDEEIEGIPAALAGAIEIVVQQFITSPKIIDKVYAALPDDIRRNVERKPDKQGVETVE